MKKKRRRWKTIVTDSHDVAAGDGEVIRSPFAPEGLGSAVQTTAEAQARSRFTNPLTAPDFSWSALARATATAYCKAEGYHRARRAATVVPDTIIWVYSTDRDPGPGYRYQARQWRQWTATCEKTKRVRR